MSNQVKQFFKSVSRELNRSAEQLEWMQSHGPKMIGMSGEDVFDADHARKLVQDAMDYINGKTA